MYLEFIFGKNEENLGKSTGSEGGWLLESHRQMLPCSEMTRKNIRQKNFKALDRRAFFYVSGSSPTGIDVAR